MTIPDRRIDADYFTQSMYRYFRSNGAWRKRFTYVRFRYCSDMYRKIYGAKRYADLAMKLNAVIEQEKKASLLRIQEAMMNFMKSK